MGLTNSWVPTELRMKRTDDGHIVVTDVLLMDSIVLLARLSLARVRPCGLHCLVMGQSGETSNNTKTLSGFAKTQWSKLDQESSTKGGLTEAVPLGSVVALESVMFLSLCSSELGFIKTSAEKTKQTKHKPTVEVELSVSMRVTSNQTEHLLMPSRWFVWLSSQFHNAPPNHSIQWTTSFGEGWLGLTGGHHCVSSRLGEAAFNDGTIHPHSTSIFPGIAIQEPLPLCQISLVYHVSLCLELKRNIIIIIRAIWFSFVRPLWI